jgi:prepilin-type N-terminal cleavage/methylation domain-containing protein
MRKNNKNQKGFTLIELLVVIAIIAILAVVVILTLNPAELLRQARDSNRVSDFATLKSALGLYAADVNTTTPMYGSTTPATDELYTADSNLTAASSTGATATSSFTGAANWGFSAGTANTYYAVVSSSVRSINGNGWIPINFSAISSGAPIGALPVDPTNSGNYFYIYAATSTSYKLAAKTESVKYSYSASNDSANDIESTDGGNSSNTYEQGTNLSL